MLKYNEFPDPCQPQDNRTGWLCILGVSLVFIFNVSLIPTFGIMFEPFFEGSNESATIILNLFQFLSNLTIIATGFMLKDLSAKHFVIIGSSITVLGLLFTPFVTTLTQLVFTFPVMLGVGIGMLNPACFVAVLSCFTCQTVSAISVGFAALGLGQMIMPMIVKQCLADYGFHTTLYIITGLSLIGLFGANLLVPIKWRPRVEPDPEAQPLMTKTVYGNSTVILKEIIHATDLDLLSSLKYIVIIFGLCIVYSSAMNFNIIFPVYLQKREKYDSIQIVNCVFTLTVSDIISRLGYPLLHNTFKFSSRAAFMFGVCGLAVVRLFIIHMDLGNYQLLQFVCVAFGFFRAITVVNQVMVLVDFSEENCPIKLPGTLGLSVVIKAATLPFFSWLFSGMTAISSDLSITFYTQVVLFGVLILLWFLEHDSTPEPPQRYYRRARSFQHGVMEDNERISFSF